MNELRDKRKNSGKIFYTRMEELRDLFPPCDVGEIILAAWDYEQYGIEYDFKNERNEKYPSISENVAMQVEYMNLVRDFKLLADSFNASCEQKRGNANKRWEKERAKVSENQTTEADKTDIAKEFAEHYKAQGIKNVRALKATLENIGMHDEDTQSAIIQEFSKLV